MAYSTVTSESRASVISPRGRVTKLTIFTRRLMRVPAATATRTTTSRGHLRNRHRTGYDLARLAAGYSALNPHIVPGRTPGTTTIDFGDSLAVAALNSALMAVDYGVRGFEIPPDTISPGIPGRADYVHQLADLLADDCDGVVPRGGAVRGLDIGCGASCVYPLLGVADYGWSFVGSDVSERSLDLAQQILDRAGVEGVQLRRQHDATSVLRGVLREGERFAFTMCNPPFYASADAAAAASTRKWRGLGKAGGGARRSFGGTQGELWCAGGERRFVATHIRQSAAAPHASLWYTSLVSSEASMPKLRAELRAARATRCEELRLDSANKRGRVLAWSFMADAPRRAALRGGGGGGGGGRARGGGGAVMCAARDDDDKEVVEEAVDVDIEEVELEPTSFAALGLSRAMQRAAAAQGWAAPTRVQAQAIPAILAGADCCVEAETGSGKTAAFALPLLQRLAESAPRRRGNHVQALVLSPTRELATQTAETFIAISRALHADAGGSGVPPRIAAVHGGVSINPQLRALGGGAAVLVATPGRLLELLACNGVCLAESAVLLLDEADRLVAPAFADELAAVIEQLPPRRQTLLFSATFPYASRPRAERLLRDPVRLSPSSSSSSSSSSLSGDSVHGGGADDDTVAAAAVASAAERYATAPPPETIEQRAIAVDVRQRTPLLRHLLATEGWRRALVFVASQKAAEHVAQKLAASGVAAAALHGGLSQQLREERLEQLCASALRVVVATNVAARGLDVVGLEAIVNYELPRSTADYTHRVGRTGRAGAAGVAVSFVASTGPGNEAHFQLIERRHGGMSVPREVVPGFEPKDEERLFAPAVVAASEAGAGGEAEAAGPGVPGVSHSQLGLAHDRMHGGVKGRRKSKKDKLREQHAAAARAAGSA